MTSSFDVRTLTYDGYPMDFISTNITVNFFCEYPCASCDNDNPSRCLSCYQTSVERYFF